ncbi:MAG TPA: DUF4347 domain-containing protein, partial [Tichowtungia sp.]|nr:DUF4347 domain-containing protein [Tichowtungia sp.]
GETATVRIFSHGSSGVFAMGADWVNTDTIAHELHSDIAAWSDYLTENADILLYGCNVAEGLDGIEMIHNLAEVTGADVAASNDATGAEERGGDWDLEEQTGVIESAVMTETAALADFTGLMEGDPPSLNDPATQTIIEGGSMSFSGIVTALDGDGDSDMIIEAKLTQGSGGISQNDGTPAESLSAVGNIDALNTFLNSLKYVPDTDSNETATILVRVDQDSGEISDNNADWDDYTTFNVTITAQPDAPTLSGNASLTQAISEDPDPLPSGNTVSTLYGSLYQDVDTADTLAGIAIVADASNSAQGTWQYSVDSGSTWTDIGSVSSSSALLLDTSTLLRFNPAEDYHGDPGSLTVRAVDSSGTRTFTSNETAQHINAGSGDTDLSTNTATLSTSVTAVNDAPTTESFTLTVTKNVTLTNINLTTHADDVDGGTDNTTDASISSYKITAIPDAEAGVLQKADGTSLSVDDTLTPTEAAALKFVPVTNYTGDATFSFQAVDAAGATSEADTVTITVETFNEAPEVTVPGDQSVAEDTSAGLTISGISVSDLDAGDS